MKPRLVYSELGRRVYVLTRYTALGTSTNGVNGFAARLRAQGLPEDFLHDAPFTASGKSHAVGNGVPLPMGRAVARAVKRALGIEDLRAFCDGEAS